MDGMMMKVMQWVSCLVLDFPTLFLLLFPGTRESVVLLLLQHLIDVQEGTCHHHHRGHRKVYFYIPRVEMMQSTCVEYHVARSYSRAGRFSIKLGGGLVNGEYHFSRVKSSKKEGWKEGSVTAGLVCGGAFSGMWRRDPLLFPSSLSQSRYLH
ncbi:uncharacterized protein H6S33_005166 [Morchella sextelata]|uniref:uncharacterized protein n=1 Tax=Morchella sextelata TaxID=1174677 RepID=UPI001D039053|nr:uncharacterized protein H6S33_005166 [Morchella sextelata]KAH0605184.1 hypothetical protein H6S33_005166 [Morchella sextelata]